MFFRENRKAFTLIEVLVVVAIIAMLVAITVPAVQQAMDLARNATVKAQLHSLELGLDMFKSDRLAGNGSYPPSNDTNQPSKSGAELLCDFLVGIDLKGFDPTGNYGLTDPRRPPYIKLETAEFEDYGTNPDDGLDYIMKCKWEMPILYYRATPGEPLTSGNVANFYTEADNESFITSYTSGADPYPNTGGFDTYITNPQISNVPYKADSFILISAGKDKIYGTEDDVKNFGQ